MYLYIYIKIYIDKYILEKKMFLKKRAESRSHYPRLNKFIYCQYQNYLKVDKTLKSRTIMYYVLCTIYKVQSRQRQGQPSPSLPSAKYIRKRKKKRAKVRILEKGQLMLHGLCIYVRTYITQSKNMCIYLPQIFEKCQYNYFVEH